jgi:hypothetical protein
MSPILLGLAVMCCRVRQRLVSSANPRSPKAAHRALDGVVGTGIDFEVLAAGGLFDGNQDGDAGALISGAGQGG